MDISIKGKNKTFHLKEIKWQMNKYYNIILLPSLHFDSKSIISPSQHTLFDPLSEKDKSIATQKKN